MLSDECLVVNRWYKIDMSASVENMFFSCDEVAANIGVGGNIDVGKFAHIDSSEDGVREWLKEELLLNYRFNPANKNPPWYVPVDTEEDGRRWSR